MDAPASLRRDGRSGDDADVAAGVGEGDDVAVANGLAAFEVRTGRRVCLSGMSQHQQARDPNEDTLTRRQRILRKQLPRHSVAARLPPHLDALHHIVATTTAAGPRLGSARGTVQGNACLIVRNSS